MYNSNFNTSHVVVYLHDYTDLLGTCIFQYISCCSLSTLSTEQVTEEQIFQYISCCSLSMPLYRDLSFCVHFNTSHVVVYLTHFRAFYFFISLFALISRHFSDFYQAPRLYYFQCLVLHKSLVFTILFHFSQLSRLVNFLQISFSFLYH